MTPRARILTGTWVILMLLAGMSVWLVDHRIASRATIVMIMGLAVVKSCLVLVQYMDLRRASIGIQLCLMAWLASSTVAVIALR